MILELVSAGIGVGLGFFLKSVLPKKGYSGPRCPWEPCAYPLPKMPIFKKVGAVPSYVPEKCQGCDNWLKWDDWDDEFVRWSEQ